MECSLAPLEELTISRGGDSWPRGERRGCHSARGYGTASRGARICRLRLKEGVGHTGEEEETEGQLEQSLEEWGQRESLAPPWASVPHFCLEPLPFVIFVSQINTHNHVKFSTQDFVSFLKGNPPG